MIFPLFTSLYSRFVLAVFFYDIHISVIPKTDEKASQSTARPAECVLSMHNFLEMEGMESWKQCIANLTNKLKDDINN